MSASEIKKLVKNYFHFLDLWLKTKDEKAAAIMRGYERKLRSACKSDDDKWNDFLAQ